MNIVIKIGVRKQRSRMRKFFYWVVFFPTVAAFLLPSAVQEACLKKRLDCIDDQMLRLIETRLKLVEVLDENGKYSYEYKHNRKTIERLNEKSALSNHALVSSVWTLLGNYSREKHHKKVLRE